MARTLSRVLIYGQDGSCLDEIKVTTVRSWMINDLATCEFALPFTDNKCTSDLLAFGNRVLVQSDNLPDWVGYISLPRKWVTQGAVGVTATSMEGILSTRNSKAFSGTVQGVFYDIFSYANSKGDTGITAIANVSSVTSVGTFGSPSQSLYQTFMDVLKNTYTEFSVLGTIDTSGRLSVSIELYSTLFYDYRNFALEEGVNIEAQSNYSLIEQGPLVNYVDVFFEGSSYAAASYGDSLSQSSNGLFETTLTIKSGSNANQVAIDYVNSHAWPSKSWVLAAININDTFSYMRPGAVTYLITTRSGFGGQGIGTDVVVRITGMSYSDITGKLILIAEEYKL